MGVVGVADAVRVLCARPVCIVCIVVVVSVVVVVGVMSVRVLKYTRTLFSWHSTPHISFPCGLANTCSCAAH
jgi:hypothetical protein